jgi:hypothetical protein
MENNIAIRKGRSWKGATAQVARANQGVEYTLLKPHRENVFKGNKFVLYTINGYEARSASSTRTIGNLDLCNEHKLSSTSVSLLIFSLGISHLRGDPSPTPVPTNKRDLSGRSS